MSYPSYPEYSGVSVDWLGEIPAHWKLISLRRAVKKISNGLTATQVDEATETIPVTRIETISHGFIDFGKVGHVPYEEANGRFLLRYGDILLSHINSLPMVGNVAINLSDRNLLHGMNLLRVQCDRKECAPLYLYYWLKSKNLRQEIESRAKPAINQASLPVDEIKKLPCLAPPLKEQTQIARFLDHQTARIDALIAEQQRLIELLKEKRQAVISHAVTKGLDPNVGIKDSGVEWLGEVPAHWTLSSLKYAVTFQRGHDLPSENRVEGEFPVVTSGGVNGTHNQYMSKGPGLVTGRYGSVGTFFLIESSYWPLNTTLYSIDFRGNNVRFLWYMLRHISDLFISESSKSAVSGIDRNDIHRTIVAVPPLDEQEQIVGFIEPQLDEIELLITRSKESITLLNERRSALISAAVTGKIDVRNWQPPTSETFPNSSVREGIPA